MSACIIVTCSLGSAFLDFFVLEFLPFVTGPGVLLEVIAGLAGLAAAAGFFGFLGFRVPLLMPVVLPVVRPESGCDGGTPSESDGDGGTGDGGTPSSKWMPYEQTDGCVHGEINERLDQLTDSFARKIPS